MAELGYKRAKRLVYIADWSNDHVIHAVLFDTFGTPKSFLRADFAFKNGEIEKSTNRPFNMYNGFVEDTGIWGKYDFKMRFDFSFLHEKMPQKITQWNLFLPDLSPAEFSSKLQEQIREKLFPIDKPIRDLRDLYERLMADEKPCFWYQTSGAIRATHLLQIGPRIGISREKVRAGLEAHKVVISAGLRKVDADDYLDRVCEQLDRDLH